MVTVKCEKTGIEFEAKTRRTKNHPVVQEWLSTAYEEGWLDRANNVIYGSRGGYGKVTFTSIEEFVPYFEQLQVRCLHDKDVEEKAKRERERSDKDAARERHITNDLLRGRGYCWKKYENDEEDVDLGGLPAVEWALYSPDGRVVTVRQAMTELATGQNVKFAIEWLEEHK